VVEAGWEKEMEYANHLEACYLMQGEAEITDLTTGEKHQLGPGSVYALDAYDRHMLHAKSELRLICVFNPALAGGETHNETGGFPADQD
jgi:L-ectoine synthase